MTGRGYSQPAPQDAIEAEIAVSGGSAGAVDRSNDGRRAKGGSGVKHPGLSAPRVG